MKHMVKLISPAKVNLVLAVGNRREDGFHEVATIMHALSLHDTLTLRRFDEEDETGLVVRLTCETSGDIAPLEVSPQDNIVYKAIVALTQALGRTCSETIEVSLSKVIPAEAGLGGGSSNAAAALVGAATLWGIDPKDAVVLDVAASLGADVSFFLHGGCAYLTGRGDVYEGSLEPRKGFVLLVRPDAGISTTKAYAAFDEQPYLPEEDYLASLSSCKQAIDIKPWNNLEPAACSLVPEVDQVIQWARQMAQAEHVLLCGSGSTVCLICESYDAACECSVEAHKQGWWSRVTSFAPLGAAVVKAM